MKLIKNISILGLILCTSFQWAIGNDRIEKPNVLFISIDDLNDWVGEFAGNNTQYG